MTKRRTSWITLFVLLCDVVLLALVLSQSAVGYAVLVSTSLLAFVHVYLVMHECVHGAVFAQHRYNEWLGHLLGFAIGCPFLTRRRAHALHHAWTGHPDRDPTNARAIERLSALSPRQLRVLDVLWRMHVPFLSLNERLGLWRAAFGARAVSERRAGYAYLFGYLVALSAFGLPAWLALAWVLSLIVEEMINLPHHLHAPFTQQRLALSQQGSVTHSCAQVPVWSRWVLLNFGLHEAHHRWPGLPWFELPAAHRALAQPSFVSNELVWSYVQRRQPFVKALGAYIRPR